MGIRGRLNPSVLFGLPVRPPYSRDIDPPILGRDKWGRIYAGCYACGKRIHLDHDVHHDWRGYVLTCPRCRAEQVLRLRRPLSWRGRA